MRLKSLPAGGVILVLLLLSLCLSALGPEKRTEPRQVAISSFKSFTDQAISTQRLDQHLRYFTSAPHPASTPRNRELARFVLDQWNAYGLEDVHFAEYDVLLSFPEKISVEMISPKKYNLKLAEAPYPEDPDTQKVVGIPYNAYSRSGEILAPLVYANSGNPQDFDYLEKKGLQLEGKIALVRYSAPYSYRGFKALTAEKRGLAGLLIYSDPKEDGWTRGPVFPQGPWGPMSHIQRGGIPYDFIYPGDPLTPGWASTPGAKRISPEEARTIPKILSVPISAEDAQPLLEAMSGEKAPEEWQGALPLVYRLGGDNPRIQIQVRMDNSVKRITNVIGYIKGSKNPDQIVLVGNHRDAWVYGGADPSSGTACLMELARAFGEAKKAGFVPRRSVYFANWDAEEFTLTGSTEWGEENRDRLKKNLIAYLNVDTSVTGKNFSVSAVPSLTRVILNSLREVPDPATGKAIYERWKTGSAEKGTIVTAGGSGRINPIGSGSDHTVFLNYICAPALDMSFGGDYGVYHSMYDDYYWMSHFGDPGMVYTAALARIWAHQTVDLSCGQFLPLDFETYGSELEEYLGEWTRQNDPAKKSLKSVSPLVREMRNRAAGINPYLFGSKDLKSDVGQEEVQRINRLLLEMERDFALPQGIPGRDWFKHLIFGARYTYAVLLLPELTEAAEAKDEKGISLAILHLEESLRKVNQKLGDIARLMGLPGEGKDR